VCGSHEEEMNGRLERWRDSLITDGPLSSSSSSEAEGEPDLGGNAIEAEPERGRPRCRQGTTRNRRRVTRGREEGMTFSQRLAAAQERIARERERRLMQEMLGGEFMPHTSSASSSSGCGCSYYDEDEEERNNLSEEEERRRMEGEEDETRGGTVEAEHTATTSAEVDLYAENGVEPHENAKEMRELEEMLRDCSIRGWILRKFAIQKKVRFLDGEEHAPATLVSDDAARLRVVDALYDANAVADDARHNLTAQPWVVSEVELKAQRTRSWESSLGVAHPYEGWMVGERLLSEEDLAKEQEVIGAVEKRRVFDGVLLELRKRCKRFRGVFVKDGRKELGTVVVVGNV
jgi:hypothetical protein